MSPSSGRQGNLVRGRARRGSYAVEFALVLPVLLALMAAVIDYGWFFFQQTMAVHAVGEAARTGAMLEEGASAARTAQEIVAERMAEAGVDCAGGSATCTVTTAYETDAGMRVLRVSTEIAFASLTGMVPVPTAIVARSSSALEEQEDDDGDDCPAGEPGCSGVPDAARTGSGGQRENRR